MARCMAAGAVALLPIVGSVALVVWTEGSLAGSWLAQQPFYFPGLGILVAAAVVYGIGLFVTTFLGRWLWRTVDRLAERLPLLGTMYQSIKEVLGYDTSRERFFQGVVLVESGGGDQLGLVTGATVIDGVERTIVFVPGTPNPATGRLLLVPTAELRRVDIRVANSLRALVAMGKSPHVGDEEVSQNPTMSVAVAAPELPSPGEARRRS